MLGLGILTASSKTFKQFAVPQLDPFQLHSSWVLAICQGRGLWENTEDRAMPDGLQLSLGGCSEEKLVPQIWNRNFSISAVVGLQ